MVGAVVLRIACRCAQIGRVDTHTLPTRVTATTRSSNVEDTLSLILNYFPCPVCQTKTRLKHHVLFAAKAKLFYGCNGCRHHWQVLTMEGQAPKIVAESPREGDGFRILALEPDGPQQMGCPRCGRYGPVKATERRTDNATVRRHKCPTDGWYFSCTDADGNVEVTKLRPNLKVRDAA